MNDVVIGLVPSAPTALFRLITSSIPNFHHSSKKNSVLISFLSVFSDSELENYVMTLDQNCANKRRELHPNFVHLRQFAKVLVAKVSIGDLNFCGRVGGAGTSDRSRDLQLT